MSHATDRNEAVMTVIYGLQTFQQFQDYGSDKNPRFCTLVSALQKSGRNHKISGSPVAGPVFRYSTRKNGRVGKYESKSEQHSTVGEVSQLLEVLALAIATGWPRQRCTKSPRLRQLAE